MVKAGGHLWSTNSNLSAASVLLIECSFPLIFKLLNLFSEVSLTMVKISVIILFLVDVEERRCSCNDSPQDGGPVFFLSRQVAE